MTHWNTVPYAPGCSPVSAALERLSLHPSDIHLRHDTLVAKHQSAAQVNSLSRRYGLGEQAPHTDGAHLANPPDYLVLWATEWTATPTLLRSFDASRLRDPVFAALAKTVWSVRLNSHRYYYVRPITLAPFRIRWDPGCFVRDRTKRVGIAEVEEAIAALPIHEFRWRPGEALVVDNRRTLHARAAVVDPEGRRILHRTAIHLR